jgi:hypothetical protein
MNNNNVTAVFQSELISGERILWTGNPNPSKLLNSGDIFLIPFSALWWGFALFWETTVLFSVRPEGFIGIFFPVFGSFFVIIGFYFAIGRFIYKHLKRKRTYYAITNKRILIKTDFFGNSTQALFLKDLPTINKVNKKNRSGSIIFGTTTLNSALYNDSGMDLMTAFNNIPIVPAFYDIEQVDQVYEKIVKLRE